MNSYIKTLYSKDEKGKNDYPQKLCRYIYDNYFRIEDKKILDVGFGKGNHLIGFSRLGLEVSGIDNYESVLKNTKCCDLEKEQIPFENNYFDVIFSKSVLEHIANTDNVLKESLRVLKPNGLAIFLVPDFKSQHKDFWDDYTHIHPFTKKSLQNALFINGFHDVECEYFYQLPLIWKYQWLGHFIKIINFVFPDSFKWKNQEETLHVSWIRFAKEKMLLAIALK